MSAPLEFLRKVVSVRRHLIRTKRGYKSPTQMNQHLAPIENWLKHWNSRATDQGALVIIKLYEAQIRELIPGGESGCGESMRNELEQILKLDTMKEFSFTHKDQNYLARYVVDEANQKIELRGIFLPKDDRNIIAAFSNSLLQSVQAHLETTHLTHAA